MRLRASSSPPPSPAQSWLLTSQALLLLTVLIHAVNLNVTNDESVIKVAQELAKGLRSYYTGDAPGNVPGTLPPPYYWWEAGGMFGGLIDYWFYTGDSTYNSIIIQAMVHQASPTRNFMPVNQTRSEGNDDQSFWALAAMAAAERNFPSPPPDQPDWLALVQGTFNSQAARWNTETCGGGLKWQIYPFNSGYNYKNTISNGCFFNIGARLATYTGNKSYAVWAEKAWDWIESVGLVTDNYQFLDGADDEQNCTKPDPIRWTYNAGVNMLGTAHMYKFTNGSDKWRTRLQGILDALDIFLRPETSILFESACEPYNTCKTDQLSFKAYLVRWMAATTQVAPFTAKRIMPILAASAAGAAKACAEGAGPDLTTACSLKWDVGKFEGVTGVGQQLAALEVVQSNMVRSVPPPVSASTGGTSKGDPGAGYRHNSDVPPEIATRRITVGDRAAAGILTVILLGSIVGGAYVLFT
ncbi:mannan endo-1,6-alpha-mannosidase, variant 2 [Blastomyces dermatitidis ER-3]|uniref:Mannan endo-1,6-alpha-mannosidase n=1 Tax=Ajellomyces dermatitidis (strain ER-3 / ATCC MYA-2586) TaxID=559297 RepID=A0ABP2ERN2_AJEDR|nr:mannan endo-1,6-alpha-mannosidase [Blastomyces dermatitidis ER-3]XP_045282941.1 mannan endo-1,6-alpha-mannosidase, variant 1 [Blastomyces dermatitidis ER-3]XP_045282942.1 mannan endo-1,6-alpha-mannosidase, variant 2 [Blastomyces dermatitidis ER-3]EQL30573.1 mannan endo-1,6-alpha-mannosidase [Blastomyces dermatitidis ATCC 26199]EEQ86176.1 mannan endo-1,6-alpha-mannosidase [Blastomyces dermatitidis ER-3]EQL30574.1 mannan endo-1,6-alpha-mannosidase, variant 1 [Blastomyces dermatitidis ATCC 261